MTVFPSNTPPRDDEGPASGPTMLTAFAAMVTALARLIEAERDLDGYAGQDPAVDAWIRDAEAARSEVLDRITEVLGEEIGLDDTAPVLQGMACYVLTALLAEDASEALSLEHWRKAARASEYLPDEAPAQVHHLVDCSIALLGAFLTLELGSWPDPGRPLAA